MQLGDFYLFTFPYHPEKFYKVKKCIELQAQTHTNKHSQADDSKSFNLISSTDISTKQKIKTQAFTHCVHGYDHARNVHENDATHT